MCIRDSRCGSGPACRPRRRGGGAHSRWSGRRGWPIGCDRCRCSTLAEAPLPASSTGIGHTRWATHGGPTNVNAHPHRGGVDGKLALIHNGIIENFRGLRSGLIDEGVQFLSETDTEVVAQLLARSYDKVGDLTDLVVG